MLLESLFLTELDWFDRDPTASRLSPFRKKGLFVHFTNIPKIGPNYRLNAKDTTFRNHRDPVGVYFYPVDWIFDSNSDRIKQGRQYGLERPYYFICDVDLNSNGLILSKTTWEDVEKLAKRNNWFQWIEWWRSLSEEEQKKAHVFPYYANPKIPGNFLWHFVEYLEKREPKKIAWNAAFKGLSYIYDDNTSTIHMNEPHQLLVFDTRIIKVVKAGEQFERKDNIGKSLKNNRDGFEYWRRAVVSIMNTLAEKYNGVVQWTKVDKPFGHDTASRNNREPRLFFTVDDKSFVLTFAAKFGEAFWLKYKYKKAEGEIRIEYAPDGKRKSIDDLTKEEIIQAVDKKVSEVSQLTTDLLFKPVIPEDDMKSYIESVIVNKPMTWDETTIEQDLDSGAYSKYNTITLTGKTKDKLKTAIYSKIYESQIYISSTIRLGDINVLHVNPPSNRNYKLEEIDIMLDELANYFKSACDIVMNRYTSGGWGYKPKLYEDEYIAFKGWLALECGLYLDGKIKSLMNEEIRTFLNRDDRDALVSRFEYVIRENG